MDADAVLEVLNALDDTSICVWLDGRWGVDALLGEQTEESVRRIRIQKAHGAPLPM